MKHALLGILIVTILVSDATAAPPRLRHSADAVCPAAIRRTGIQATPAVVSDTSWDTRFYIPGCDNNVNAIAALPGGGCIVGGDFRIAGSVIANQVACWDGASWRALGNGMNQSVLCLAVAGGTAENPVVIAGGMFLAAGDSTANHIARWSDGAWHPIGPGFNGNVYAVAVIHAGDHDEIIAGGAFTAAGSVALNHIARWDGYQWNPLGNGIGGTVYAIRTRTDSLGITEILAGGKFMYAGLSQALNIALWNGSDWSALGSGLTGTVRAIAFQDSGIVCGGSITGTGATALNNIARWNGTAWMPLPDGTDGPVYALCSTAAGLFVGGAYTAAGQSGAGNLALWNGVTWEATGHDPTDAVCAISDLGTGIVVGGKFTMAGSLPVGFVACWSGDTWSQLGSGLGTDGTVESIVSCAGGPAGMQFIAAGSFGSAGSIAGNQIALFDGERWQALGTGMNTSVRALSIPNPDNGPGTLYAGGYFTVAGGITAKHIARWDGSAWNSLGVGLNGPVFAIESRPLPGGGEELFAGGTFNNAGGLSVMNIARWDGYGWYPLGEGLNGSVYTIALGEDGTTLYAGGTFTKSGDSTVNHIAMWDGTSWHALGQGTSGAVQEIVIGKTGSVLSGVFAGGTFATAGVAPVKNIAVWDGVSWNSLGSGINGTVSCLSIGEDRNGTPILFAGGNFSKAGTINAGNLASWDGTSWSSPGTGIDNAVHCLQYRQGVLTIGGGFSTVAGIPSANIGLLRVNGDISGMPVRPTVLPRTMGLANYPNPFNPSTVITFSLNHPALVRMEVFNLLGQRVALLADERVAPGEYRYRWNASGLPGGVYYCRMTDGIRQLTRPLMLLR